MKTIQLLNDEGETVTGTVIKIWDKVNELIRSYNELLLSLKPSAHEVKEVPGAAVDYEPFENKITDPNDR